MSTSASTSASVARANSSEIEASIHAQHPNARVERIELSIHEARADRLRAMEEFR